MLHFLIGLAASIWIAERLWHYWREWRWRREQRRYVRWLQGEDIRSGLPSWVPQQKSQTFIDPPPVWVTAGLVVLLIAIVTLLASHA